MKKEISIGFLVGLLATSFGLFIFMEYVVHLEFKAMVEFVFTNKLWGKLLALASLPNLFVFFIFLKKKQDNRARGVIIESFLVAFLVLIAQFI